MARLIGILAAIMTLAACNSGVSNSGAGARGTSCNSSGLDLSCTATVSISPTVIDACPAVNEDGETIGISPTATANVNIIVRDPLGEFSNINQGVTFDRFEINYDTGQGGAPNLGPRVLGQTVIVELDNSVGSGTATLPIVDQVTQQQFRNQASCSTVYPYSVSIVARGRDFATNSPLTIVARTTLQIGDADGSASEESVSEEDGEESEDGDGEA